MANENEKSVTHVSEMVSSIKKQDKNEDSARPPSRKRPRKRKKSIYKPLVEQMEFYMGDANVSRSKFMKEQFDKSPWVDLDVFLTFNKMNWMLTESFGTSKTSDDLLIALKAIPSEIFEVRDDDSENNIKRGVRRKKPIPVGERANDLKTIYIERIPPNVDIDLLKHVFEKYGPVSYISLPKFKHNGIPKGFAFLEFASEEGANKALEGFIAAKRRISTALDPGQLQSIKAFHIEQEHDTKSNLGNDDDKTTSSNLDDPKNGSAKKAAVKIISGKEDHESEAEETSDVKATDGEKKAKRKRKRKNSEVHTEPQQDLLSVLQIMPRFEWKRLRNKYLNLQRKNMSHSKMRLKQFHEKRKESSYPIRNEDLEGNDGEEAPEKQLEFTPGIIVKFLVEEPIEDEKIIKKRIKAAIMENVKYVDVKVGAKEYHVRCAHADMAKTLSKATILGQATILEGDDESKYWEKIKEDRQAKLSGKVKVKSSSKKPRGQDRLKYKIQVMNQSENSHKYFDDD